MTTTRVKVCGLTRDIDVVAALAYSPWALGFVLWEHSPRAVSVTQVRELTARVPAGIRRVGVMVNPGVADVKGLMAASGLTTVQLHGDEDVAPFLSLGLEVIKAVALSSPADVERAAALPEEVTILVDAVDVALRGGTGRPADWTLAASLAQRRPILLAGGLRPGNVAGAIAQVGPFGVDVSSGLETAPGIKDPAKIEAFFAAVGRVGVRPAPESR